MKHMKPSHYDTPEIIFHSCETLYIVIKPEYCHILHE